ncbi:MAG: PIG-L family deacetylase [bacterium]|nr:PIG-L family deacetylase [bacterium]
MRIAAIFAHPDDIELMAAGTLTLLKRGGHEIFMATMTPGDKGSPDKNQVEISAIRMEEAKRSANRLGADYECLGFSDLEIYDDERTRRGVVEYLRRARPDIILTASPVDYMPDHEITAAVVRTAAFAAGIRNYHSGAASPLTGIPALYYADAMEGTDHFGEAIQPEFCIDVSDAISEKAEMLACHASQREWLRAHHGMDEYIEAMMRFSAARGALIGADYAEGFRQHRGHAYPHEPRLQELLPEYTHPIQNMKSNG